MKKKFDPVTTKHTRLPKLVLLSLLLIVFSLTFFKISGDDDVFWHLATGRYIVDHKALPQTDIFSFPNPQQSWTSNSWLWDVISFFVYKASGFVGICILRSLIILTMFALWIKTAAKLKVPEWLTALLLAGAAFGMMERFDPRPHIVSFLFFTILFVTIINYVYLNKRSNRILYSVPILFLVWSNFHPGVILGLLLLSVFLFSMGLMYFAKTFLKNISVVSIQKKELLRVLLVFILSAIAMLCNPSGYTHYLNAISSSNTEILKGIYEWISPFHQLYGGSIMGFAYKIFLALSLVIFIYAVKKRDAFAFFTTVVFVIYSMQAVRSAVDLFLVIPILALIATERLGLFQLMFRQELKSKTENVISILAIAACVVAFLYVTTNRVYAHSVICRRTGIGVDQSFYPYQLFDYIKKNNIQNTGERPFNSYECGGLFAWTFPGKKNFIDSRLANMKSYQDYDKISNKNEGFEKEFKAYDFDYIIVFFDAYFVPSSELILRKLQSSILSFLFDDDKNWKLVYWDDKSFLFLKNNAAFKGLIERDEYRYLSPYTYLYRKSIITDAATNDKAGLQKEYSRKLTEEKNGVIINAMAKNVSPLLEN